MAGTGDQTEAQARLLAGVADSQNGNRGVSTQVPTDLPTQVVGEAECTGKQWRKKVYPGPLRKPPVSDQPGGKAKQSSNTMLFVIYLILLDYSSSLPPPKSLVKL